MTDYPIGHVFQYKNVKLKVVKTNEECSCKGCCFNNIDYYCPNVYCCSLARKDNNDVIFVETDEPLAEE